jgi:hypothetical protein
MNKFVIIIVTAIIIITTTTKQEQQQNCTYTPELESVKTMNLAE